MPKASLFLLAAIVAEVIATTLLKMSDGFTRFWPGAGCTVGYIVAFYALSQCLRTMNVGVAYGIWCGLGIVLISVLAFVVYKERLDVPAIVGLGMIIGGVLVIQFLSKTIHR